MGLDMYLNKYHRYKDTTPDEIDAVGEYLSWLLLREKGNKYALEADDFVEWVGGEIANNLPDVETINFYKEHIRFPYAHSPNYCTCYEEVAYWRKANAIHRWFVENVQDDEDDCEYHREVTKEDLETLRGLCTQVIENCILGIGKVRNGQLLTEKDFEDIIEDGKTILNPEVAHELLPVQSGFLFGSTDYDEYYMSDIIYTHKVIGEILASTDFEKEMIYYISSW